ncbi:MAG: hypothetical protein IJZ86_07600 [Bacteroides sp.]|nr:hypothetical protein [Bacteroides sp.]
MSAMELNAEILRQLSYIADEESAMQEVLEYIKGVVRRHTAGDSPCCYSLDEVKLRLQRTEADAIAGRGLSTEEVFAMSEEWL